MPAERRSDQRHWDEVYANTAMDQTGWFEDSPTVSLSLIDHGELGADDAALDVGAGTSSLAPALIERGVGDVTVLDISERALEALRSGLEPAVAERIRFVRADITDPVALESAPPLQLWHDRAMLHFLIEDDQCDRYAAAVNAAVAPGGYALLATYALHGAST